MNKPIPLLSALLVPLIAVKYAYDRFSLLASSLGFVVLLVAFGATWLLTRTARQEDSPTMKAVPATDHTTASSRNQSRRWYQCHSCSPVP